MLVEAEVENVVPGGAVVRVDGEGRMRFFIALAWDSPIRREDRVRLDVDLEAVTARLVRILRKDEEKKWTTSSKESRPAVVPRIVDQWDTELHP